MPALDDPLSEFAALRGRALGLLQGLAGHTWTDHNHHDPGITVLETLCYVLTDLGYRSAWPVPDLIADAPGLFTPAQVLPSGPITLDDWRKWLIDLPGVGNAWITRADAPLAVHDAAQQLLRVLSPSDAAGSGEGGATRSPNLSALCPGGLYRVWLEKSGLGDDVDGSTLVRQAAERLQRWRSLGEDVVEITVLDRQPVAVEAELEIAPGADPTGVLAGLHEALARHMAPPLPWRSLREMRARGWRVDQVFEGPLLSRGFLDPAEWAGVVRRDALRLSDLIQVLMAVPGVVAVKRVAFLRDGQALADWLLPLAADRSPAYDLGGSRLGLTRRGLRVDHDGVQAAARRRAEARARQAAAGAGAGSERDLPAPAGRARQPGRYGSLMQHLPAAYGVGPAGLSSAEPPERLARAQQLKAYLLLFDQLLANQFAQLGQAGWLLAGLDDPAQAIAAQAVPDEGGALRLDGVRRSTGVAHALRVEALARDPGGDDPADARGLASRHRMLDHLLARLGEQWAEAGAEAGLGDGGVDGVDEPGTRDGLEATLRRVLRDKQAFLRDYPQLSLRRGAGEDLLGEAPGPAPAESDPAPAPAGAPDAGHAMAAPAVAVSAAAPAADAGGGVAASASADADAAAPDSADAAAPAAAPAADGATAEAPGPAGGPSTAAALAAAIEASAVAAAAAAEAAAAAAGRTLAEPPPASAAPAGLALRLNRLLGLDPQTERCVLVEHILLRPLPGDAFQQGPWLRGVPQADPFSLWLTLVLPAQGGRLADAEFRRRVAQVARDEAPAHLALRLLWLDAEALAEFDRVHACWRALWRQALQQRFGLAPGPAGDAPDHQHALRSARNRLIDVLGLGDSFPLTDLVVADGSVGGPIKVAHGRPAYIAVDASEPGVRYTLRGPDGRPLTGADGQALAVMAVDGNGGRVVLETPPVTDDIRLRVLATKLRAAPGLPPQPPVLLDQGASVKVGLDTRLAMEWADLPLLDTTLPSPQPGDTRLAAWGTRATVRVHQSQEGVAYALVIDGTVQGDAVVGDLGTIALQTPPLQEDAEVAVQARKTFGAGGDSLSADVALLEARLRVAVLADPGLALQALPGPVLAWRQAGAALRVQRSQASARYRVFARRVRDAEWLRDAGDAAALLRALPEAPAVAAPAWSADATPPPGFLPLGEALAGNGGALDLPLGEPTDDAVYLVQASKQHAGAADSAPVRTTVGLQQALLLLTRPDPAPALRLTLVQGPDAAAPELEVADGQPGVFYRFRVRPDGPALAQDAYMHQRSEGDAGLNKGLGQLGLGLDLVVAGPPAATDAPDKRPPEQRPPALPRLPLGSVAADAELAVQAIKAQTGLAVDLPATLRLAPLPAVKLDPSVVAAGEAVRVRVAASLAGERYRLLRADAEPGQAVPGTGAELVLDGGPVDRDGLLVLQVAPVDAAGGLALARSVVLPLWLLPRADRALSARPASVASGGAAEVLVAGSEPGVRYQLLAGEGAAAQPVGLPQPGQGGDLALPTGALTADTRFQVRAVRVVDARASVLLAGEVRITVLPAG